MPPKKQQVTLQASGCCAFLLALLALLALFGAVCLLHLILPFILP